MQFFRSPKAAPEAPPEPPPRLPPHDFAAESEVLAHFFNFTREDVAASAAGCAAAAGRPSVKRVAWFIPQSNNAFAAGIHTILRVAEYLRTSAGIGQVFCVIGAASEKSARARVADAYPELAAAATFVVTERLDERLDLGPVDAAIATLWMTTARNSG